MKGISKKGICKFLLFFGLSFLVSILLTTVHITNRSMLEQTQMEQLAMSKANKVNNVLTKLLYKTQILSAFVQQSDGYIENFEQLGSSILDDPSVRNVLLAPDGVVSHVYPLAGNESVLGLNYFAEGDGNQEAILARNTGQLVLGGPFNLVQGGQALVGRLPVYLQKDGESVFWGIVSVTLNYPQALDGADLDLLRNQGFAFEIWRINPDTGNRQVIAQSDYSYSPKDSYVEHPMDILNAKWYFRLSPIRSWYEFPETWLLLLFGLCVSLLVGFLILHNHDLSTMKRDLEQLSLHDALTGVLNRRGCFQQLELLCARPDHPFVLCYLDLNRFKTINDQFGHNTGDRVLCHLSDLISRLVQQTPHLFARIGGDEFILVVKNTSTVSDAGALLAQLNAQLAQDILLIHDQPLKITYSTGYAAFPEDGRTLDDLIATADHRMYISKQREHAAELR